MRVSAVQCCNRLKKSKRLQRLQPQRFAAARRNLARAPLHPAIGRIPPLPLISESV
jgi:hypothetical protein